MHHEGKEGQYIKDLEAGFIHTGTKIYIFFKDEIKINFKSVNYTKI